LSLRCFWTRRTIEFTGIYGVVKPNELVAIKAIRTQRPSCVER